MRREGKPKSQSEKGEVSGTVNADPNAFQKLFRQFIRLQPAKSAN